MMRDFSIPSEWLLTEIGEISDVVSGGTPKSSNENFFTTPPNGIAWLTPADLSGYDKKFISHGKRNITEEGYKNSSARIMPKGSVVFSSRAPIGYVAIAENEISTNQGFKSFVIPNEISSDYLYFYLRSIKDLAESLGTGTTFKEISASTCKKLPFKLPPKAEQEKIAELLDGHLAQVENVKSRLNAIFPILKKFRQSVLADAVSGRLTENWRLNQKDLENIQLLINEIEQERNSLKKAKKLKSSFGRTKNISPLIEVPTKWKTVSFEDISKNHNHALKAGPFGSALKKSDCVESGYKVYGQEQVIAEDEKLITYFINDQKFEDLKSCEVESGDILISLVGTIGKVLILSENAEQGIINPRLVKLSLNEKINRKYIKIFLESTLAKSFFMSFSHGGTMEILNLSILKDLPIPLPPIEEQREIVQRVEQLFTYADSIENQINNALQRVNQLTQSILHQAFTGRLTADWRTQNPDQITGDNSAKKLLEQIQNQKTAQNKEKTTKKPKT